MACNRNSSLDNELHGFHLAHRRLDEVLQREKAEGRDDETALTALTDSLWINQTFFSASGVSLSVCKAVIPPHAELDEDVYAILDKPEFTSSSARGVRFILRRGRASN